MGASADIYRGCLLGLAVGDALGVTVDGKSYQRICQDYGPAGLLGYDLVNGCANISSHTQVAAFALNGLLVAVNKGRTGMEDCLHYITRALGEWAHAQHLPGAPRSRCCWMYHVPQMRQRRCMDARTLDSLTRDVTGTMEAPANQSGGPGTLAAAAMVGLYFSPERMEASDIGPLAGQTVALTHGDPMAFLSGAALAYALAGIIQEPQAALEDQFTQAAKAVLGQFGKHYPQAKTVHDMILQGIYAYHQPELLPVQAMEMLGCGTAAQVLAGAVYACLAGNGDFDSTMIIAVNHSGKSAAVGALAGALMGARLGEQALPDFYLEGLACADVLRELAEDLDNCGPKGWRSRLFDHDWDRKYTQGLPAER